MRKPDPIDPAIERELDAIDAALAGRDVAPELTELGALALALREDRPQAPPMPVLDSKVAAGFPDTGTWRAALRTRVKNALTTKPMMVPGFAASMILALVVGLAVINGGGGYESESTSGAAAGSAAQSDDLAGGGSVGAGGTDGGEAEFAEPVSGQSAARQAKPKTSVSGSSPITEDSVSSAGSGPVPSPPIAPPGGGGGSPGSDAKRARKVERSASLVLATAPGNLSRVADGIIRVTDGVGGFVVTSSVSSTIDGGSGTFEIRVPSDRLQQALAQLSRLGNVRERQETQEDITASFASATDRLTDARAERKGLLRALARATSLNESSSIRARLRDVSSRIANAKADLARVNNRANYSNVSVSLVGDETAGEPGAGIDDGRWSPGDAARDAVRVLEVAAGVALIALAVVVPLVLIAFPLALGARLATRRRRERALDLAA